jgi:hypothetical protein
LAPLVRGTNVDALVLGDVVALTFPQSPNSGKRYGDVPAVGGRAFQVVQITEGAATRTVAFQDVGSIVAFSGTAPTISIDRLIEYFMGTPGSYGKEFKDD